MFNHKRAKIITLLISILFIFSLGKLFFVQVIQGLSVSKNNNSWNVITLKIPAKRGNIFDRNGVLLATDVESYVLYVDRKIIKSKNSVAEILERMGIMSEDDFYERLNSTTSRVVLLKKGIKKKDVERLDKIRGLFCSLEWERFYPYNHTLRTLLGKLDFERKGISGIEKQFDKYLTGREGMVTYILNLRNKYRYIKYPQGKNVGPQKGKDIFLTIDIEIQDICDKVARKTLKITGAKNVICVVVEPKTGEILGLADVPEISEKKEWKKNSFVENEYEPGSIFKIIPATLWLIQKRDTSVIVCQKNEKKTFNNKTLKDENEHPPYNFVQAFTYSSNVGFVNIGFELGLKKIAKLSKEFGLFSKTGIELPYEGKGTPFKENYKYNIEIANVFFGQGFKVTPIQITFAYTIFGNGGKLTKPMIVKKITDGKIEIQTFKPQIVRNVISKEVTKNMIEIMKTVLTDGTGKNANISGIKIIGKTGTGAQSSNSGYDDTRYLSSFIGILNPENDGILIGVFVDEPRGNHKASIVATPAFKEIAERIITLKNYRDRFLRSIAYEK